MGWEVVEEFYFSQIRYIRRMCQGNSQSSFQSSLDLERNPRNWSNLGNHFFPNKISCRIPDYKKDK